MRTVQYERWLTYCLQLHSGCAPFEGLSAYRVMFLVTIQGTRPECKYCISAGITDPQDLIGNMMSRCLNKASSLRPCMADICKEILHITSVEDPTVSNFHLHGCH
jgi:hypothetical protein